MDQIEFSLWKLSAPCKPNVVKNPSVHICFEVEPSAGGRPKNLGGNHYLLQSALMEKVLNRPKSWGGWPPLPPCSTGPGTYRITYVLSEILEMYLLQTTVQYVQGTTTYLLRTYFT